MVAASNPDGRLYFLSCSSTEFEDLELLGYIALQDLIFSIIWDIPTSRSSEEQYLLVSLARGEIVKLMAPIDKAPTAGLLFEDSALSRISFRTIVPLLGIVLGKYYMQKEKIERKVLWGMGQDKKLLQYRLPQNIQAWTGPDGTPLNAHINLPGHSKPGSALVLHREASILMTGAEDGVLQLRTSVLDPLRSPEKIVEAHMYDGYKGGMLCMIEARGRIFTAGADGVMFCCEFPELGMKRRTFNPCGLVEYVASTSIIGAFPFFLQNILQD
eukprot:Gb_13923 [translate_table: standard]